MSEIQPLPPEDSVLDEEAPQKRSSWKKLTIEVIETIILTAFLFFVINLVSARIRVESISMQPTLDPGDFVIVDKLSYNFRQPKRGEVVVFHLPTDDSQRYIKRVIGLPGDDVWISDGQVLINGIRLDEPYLDVSTNRGGNWQVPENSYFVMGDNRNNSSDSRVWGMVGEEKLIGKAFLIYWPPPQWDLLGNVVLASP
jgi:signal peptidase I